MCTICTFDRFKFDCTSTKLNCGPHSIVGTKICTVLSQNIPVWKFNANLSVEFYLNTFFCANNENVTLFAALIMTLFEPITGILKLYYCLVG